MLTELRDFQWAGKTTTDSAAVYGGVPGQSPAVPSPACDTTPKPATVRRTKPTEQISTIPPATPTQVIPGLRIRPRGNYTPATGVRLVGTGGSPATPPIATNPRGPRAVMTLGAGMEMDPFAYRGGLWPTVVCAVDPSTGEPLYFMGTPHGPGSDDKTPSS